MSYRYSNAIVDPGLNTLVAPTPSYQPYLYSWGQNTQGPLGLGNRTNYSSPKQVGNLTNWSKISANAYYDSSLAIKTDGTLWAWGDNTYGALGLGNTTSYSSPKQVGSLTNWSSVVLCGSNQNFAFGIKTDGSLWAWGFNSAGQLGLGNTTYYSSPKQVGSLTNWLTVAGGYLTSIATKTDGTLWTWGSGQYGSLGLGNTTNYSSPKQVGALTNWLSVTASYKWSIATKTDGTLWAWGTNYFGALGTGNLNNYSSPKQIGALTNWKTVVSGNYGVYALKTDGTLWAWGRNQFGQLGLGNITSYSSPMQVGSLTNWTLIATSAASASILAIQSNGTLWGWGRGGNGALGLGNTTNYSSPKQVGSLTTWLSVASSGYHTLALQY